LGVRPISTRGPKRDQLVLCYNPWSLNINDSKTSSFIICPFLSNLEVLVKTFPSLERLGRLLYWYVGTNLGIILVCTLLWKNIPVWYHLRQYKSYTSTRLVWTRNNMKLHVVPALYLPHMRPKSALGPILVEYCDLAKLKVKIDPIPVPGWYESTQLQYLTGMWKRTYQCNTCLELPAANAPYKSAKATGCLQGVAMGFLVNSCSQCGDHP
jgi:hypothetical protein